MHWNFPLIPIDYPSGEQKSTCCAFKFWDTKPIWPLLTPRNSGSFQGNSHNIIHTGLERQKSHIRKEDISTKEKKTTTKQQHWPLLSCAVHKLADWKSTYFSLNCAFSFLLFFCLSYSRLIRCLAHLYSVCDVRGLCFEELYKGNMIVNNKPSTRIMYNPTQSPGIAPDSFRALFYQFVAAALPKRA